MTQNLKTGQKKQPSSLKTALVGADGFIETGAP